MEVLQLYKFDCTDNAYVLVFMIANSTYNYNRLIDDFSDKWEQYIENTENSN